MILMIYINDSNIFILIYPYYISILLYRLYSTILCIWLYIMSLQPGVYLLYLLMQSYMLLSTFMMIYRHEHIYSIHLSILSMLSSGTFSSASTSYLYSSGAFLYFLRLQCCFPLPHTRIYYIVFIYAFMLQMLLYF